MNFMFCVPYVDEESEFRRSVFLVLVSYAQPPTRWVKLSGPFDECFCFYFIHMSLRDWNLEVTFDYVSLIDHRH